MCRRLRAMCCLHYDGSRWKNEFPKHTDLLRTIATDEPPAKLRCQAYNKYQATSGEFHSVQHYLAFTYPWLWSHESAKLQKLTQTFPDLRNSKLCNFRHAIFKKVLFLTGTQAQWDDGGWRILLAGNRGGCHAAADLVSLCGVWI
jgi:hypothetical protein